MEPLTPRLTFDGGPWVGGFSVARLTPWAETLTGALLGALLALLFPVNPVSVGFGMVGWIVLSPLAMVVSGLAWAVSGTWLWTLDQVLLHILGGLVAGGVMADLTQAVSSQPFARRFALAVAAGTGAALLVVGNPQLLAGGG